MSFNEPQQGPVTQRFDRAAPTYDRAAPVQEQIARHLTELAERHVSTAPKKILDIGCGTGFAATAASRQWPWAQITAIDGAPAMLREAQNKLPQLRIIAGDIAEKKFAAEFDLVISSMALHWLPDPGAALRGWQQWLRPGGTLAVALLLDGSFKEWRALCAAAGVADGLWAMPKEDFCGKHDVVQRQKLSFAYPTAQDFLQRLKASGAAMPREGHMPLTATIMRRLLKDAPRPFAVTYDVLYIVIQSPGSI